MTPKEKAKELVKKFMSIDSDSEKFDGFKMGFFYAQRCALIAVDEIAKCTKYEKQKFDNDRFSEDYWQEVKTEIINL
jgi:hypothetical protein